MSNTTIFDDVFRTMMEKMPYLAIPLINEVFHTSYAEDAKIIPLHNEYHGEGGEIITDTVLLLGEKIYHLECQSTDDVTMAIRMIEYDLAIAIERAEKQERRYQVRLPESCVLYLRSNRNIPAYLEVELTFPDGKSCIYQVPTVKMEDYTKNLIFEKNLLVLLPFYVMRYEKLVQELEENPEKLKQLLAEYEEIRKQLELARKQTERSELYFNLNRLIVRISDYIFQNSKKVRKGVKSIMGGNILELESEKLIAKGKAEGRAEGEAFGEERLSILINRLIQDGRSEEVQIVVTDKDRKKALYAEYKL